MQGVKNFLSAGHRIGQYLLVCEFQNAASSNATCQSSDFYRYNLLASSAMCKAMFRLLPPWDSSPSRFPENSPLGHVRTSRSIVNCSGPIPSRGVIRPNKTWYSPLKTLDCSSAIKSRGCSQTHKSAIPFGIAANRAQRSSSDRLKQSLQ